MTTNTVMHLHTYPDGSSAQEYVLESSHAIATIDPEGGYVTSWKVKHAPTDQFINVLYRGSTKKRSGIPILFPYFGKAKRTRQHGFGRDSNWKVLHSSASSISLKLTSHDISADATKEYPYKFEAELHFSVTKSGELEYSLSVENLDDKDLPISPGIHPYWDIEHKLKKSITVDGLPDFDASAIDWDTTPPDIAYPFDKKVILQFPTRNITIENMSPDSPAIRHLVVWSQPISKPDFNFVCFEPVCGNNYAIEEDPIYVKPHQTWKMSLRFTTHFS